MGSIQNHLLRRCDHLFKDEKLELPKFDVVIHLAGAIFAKDDKEYYEYNCEATKDLVRCIERQTWKLQRFVFASSLAAAGPSLGKVLSENDIPEPVDPYGAAKLAAEDFLKTVTSFPTTSFRPAIVLGPGDENTLTLFRMARFRLGMNIGNKAQNLSYVDEDDLNDAITLMVKEKSDNHQTYFVAYPKLGTNKDIFNNLGDIMDHRVLILPIPKALLYRLMQASTFLSDRLNIKINWTINNTSN